MAQDSWVYNCGVGDGRQLSADDWHNFNEWFFNAALTSQGPIKNLFQSLEPQDMGGDVFRIKSGVALVAGVMYRNTGNVDFTVTGPGGGLQTDLIVLRWTVAANTVRLAWKQGTPGGAGATLQQDAAIWEIPIATLIKAAGTNLTSWNDERVFLHYNGMVDLNHIDDQAVGNAKIRNAAGVSVIGRSVNSTGSVADIVAGADDRVLSRAGGVLAFTQVSTGMLANDSVDDTKAGNRVPQFMRFNDRQDWAPAHDTTTTPTAVRMQAGKYSNAGSGTATITFPIAFGAAPYVVVCSISNVAGGGATAGSIASTFNPTATTFDIKYDAGAPATVIDIDWLAIGPE